MKIRYKEKEVFYLIADYDKQTELINLSEYPRNLMEGEKVIVIPTRQLELKGKSDLGNLVIKLSKKYLKKSRGLRTC